MLSNIIRSDSKPEIIKLKEFSGMCKTKEKTKKNLKTKKILENKLYWAKSCLEQKKSDPTPETVMLKEFRRIY